MNASSVAAAVLIAAGAITSPVASAGDAHRADLDVLLASINNSAGSPDLSDAAALVLGPSGDPTPAPSVVVYYLQHYLNHVGNFTGGFAEGASPEVAAFTGNVGNTFALTTPEQFTSDSYLTGDADVVHQLLSMYADGRFDDPGNPLYLLGYSQSATILTAVDSHLNDQQWLEYVLTNGSGGQYAEDLVHYADQLGSLGSIAGDLRLVLLGNPAANPLNTGDPAGWDNSPLTQVILNSGSMGYGGGTINGEPGNTLTATVSTGTPGDLNSVLTDGYGMAGQNSNMDLSPTAVYTVHGDNWAQAMLGWFGPSTTSLEHIIYPGLDASDFSLVDHIGNVDYYQADLNIFQEFAALGTAMWVSFMGMFG